MMSTRFFLALYNLFIYFHFFFLSFVFLVRKLVRKEQLRKSFTTIIIFFAKV